MLIKMDEKTKLLKNRNFCCPNCGNDKWYINKETLEKGDEPTQIECIECGFEGVA